MSRAKRRDCGLCHRTLTLRPCIRMQPQPFHRGHLDHRNKGDRHGQGSHRGRRQAGEGQGEGGLGKVTGDAKTEAEGKADKAEGRVQNAVGGMKDAARDAREKVTGKE